MIRLINQHHLPVFCKYLVSWNNTNDLPAVSSASRKDQLLAEMRSNEDTFLKDVKDAKDMERFDAEERTEEIAKLLEEYPELRQMMDELGKYLDGPSFIIRLTM